jgi:hypothetical protein
MRRAFRRKLWPAAAGAAACGPDARGGAECLAPCHVISAPNEMVRQVDWDSSMSIEGRR